MIQFLYICLTVLVSLLGSKVACAGSDGSVHQLAIFTPDREHNATMMEFIRHYLEEGVDHFFIHGKEPMDALVNNLKCIDSNLYTIYSEADFKRKDAYKAVKSKAEWLIVAEMDDFISSRSLPGKTIKEFLTEEFKDCEVVQVPQLQFSWGDVKSTPTNHLRDSLPYRWGLDAKYSKNTTEKSYKFRDINERVANKVIVHTDKVDNVRSSVAFLKRQEDICIAFDGSELSCNGESDQSAYCPPRKRYNARHSDKGVQLREVDVPHLQLASHHYRYGSDAEWNAKLLDSDRLYPHDKTFANRVDVKDAFFKEFRTPARVRHTQQQKADAIMRNCPNAA